MSENVKNSFVAYEHKDVTVKRELEAIYTDGYPNFGWKPDGRLRVFPQRSTGGTHKRQA